jgi:3-methyladenine DNA glycosylase AlkD
MAATTVLSIHEALVRALVRAGEQSPYVADANEPDARYLSYGVRAPALRGIWRSHLEQVRGLSAAHRLDLAKLLIESGYGEQQSLGSFVLELMPGHFTTANLSIIDDFVRCLRGWSKVDTFATGILQTLLLMHPEEVTSMCRSWNIDPDPWPRRTSVVIFTRKVAASGQFTDVALTLCDLLIDDPHLHVRKGVGWALKDLMRSDRERVLDYVRTLRAAGASSDIVLYAIKELDPGTRQRILEVPPVRASVER